jgi:macrodomain Ter protein organizer (MatP/YcbG family)
MDTTRFKSVTIGIGTWKKLSTMANKDMRSVTRTIEYLVHHHDFITKKYVEGEKDLTPEKYFNMYPPLKRGRRKAHE